MYNGLVSIQNSVYIPVYSTRKTPVAFFVATYDLPALLTFLLYLIFIKNITFLKKQRLLLKSRTIYS
jgi:hypothetical protein